MAQPAKKRLTYAAYLELERATDLRHELVDGEAYAMAGGTPRHSKIKANSLFQLMAALGDGPCQAYDADLKIRVRAADLATYPDASVICGDLERDEDDPNAIVNPTLLLEVLSPSTEAWDRGGKFQRLQALPSLQTYVLVSAGDPRVEVFERQPDDTWVYRSYGPADTVDLPRVGVQLPVGALYRNLPAEPEPTPEPDKG